MRKNSSNLLLLLVTVASDLFAQTDVNLQKVTNPVYPSPTAASLGKYSDIPVSYHTGVPSISIPLYTVTEGNLQLPISISYHSSGIRVDETASPIGLGWSLNAGGMISRSVNGGPDEGHPQRYGATPKNGWGFYTNYGFPPEIRQCGKRPADDSMGASGCCLIPGDKRCTTYNPSCLPCGYWYQDAAIGAVDLEPDLYSFNMNGYSGKFFFDSARNVHQIQETGVFIKPINDPDTFSSWLIITPDGTKYYFGNYHEADAKEISYSDPDGIFVNFGDFVANTTWYLTRIESLNGERWIKLEYETEYYSFGNRKGHNASLIGGGSNQDPAISDPVLAVSYVRGKRLKTISTSSGLVIVNLIPSATGRIDLNHATSDRFINLASSSDAKAISAIEIVSPGLYKKFNLTQSYFGSVPCTGCIHSPYYDADEHRKRLRLDGLFETDVNGNALPPYQFNYNSIPLPSRYSLARDAQGFYNGYDTNDGWFQDGVTIPAKNYTYTLHTGDNRQPSESYMQAAVLTQIHYPLGRRTYFEYEAHRTSLKLIGGLRVKRIMEEDEDGRQILRNFTYEQPKLYFDDRPNALLIDQNNVDNIINPEHQGAYQVYASQAPVVPLYSPQGYSIAYDRVTETQTGNGSKTYTYYSFPPEFPSNPKFPIVPDTTQPGSSELRSERTFDKNRNLVASKKLSKDTVVTGQRILGRRASIANLRNSRSGEIIYNGIALMGFSYYQDYKIISNSFVTRSEETFQQNVASTTQYTYTDNKVMPSVIETTSSRGTLERTVITYPFDIGSGAPVIMFRNDDPNYKHLIYEPIRISKIVNGDTVDIAENTFERNYPGTKISLTKSTHYPSGYKIPSRESTYRYDDNSNLKAIKSSDGVTKSFLWGYNDSYVVANGINCEPEQMFYEGFEAFTSNISTDAKTGLKSSSSTFLVPLPQPGTYVLSYWQKNKINGVWDYIINDNVTSEVSIGGPDYLIDEVRLIPKGARLTTKQFSPGLGLITETDANGNSIYYEYDGFGRLKLQRDTNKNLTKAYEYRIHQK